MAEYSRVTPDGWVQGDDATDFSRVTPTGWLQQEAVGGGGFQAAWARNSNVVIQITAEGTSQ
jgi:hypothetical protein